MKKVLSFVFVFFMVASQIISQCDDPPEYEDPMSLAGGQLEMMNIPCAWTITNGSPNVTVAIVDDYLDKANDDLVNKVIEIVGPCDPAQGNYSHGTQSFGAVAGIRNDHCIAGSGGETTVAGFCSCGSDDVLLDVMERGYKIVVVACWWPGSLTRDFMETLTANGVVVLLAGLNQYFEAEDPEGLHSVPGVIHCGRADLDGNFWNYNQGSNTDQNWNMDVLSVAEDLPRLHPGNICNISGGGTSIGTPHIAGVVALMMDINPCLTPSDYEEILVATSLEPVNAPPGATRGGVIDAYAAVVMARDFEGIDKVWSGNETISMDQISGDLTIESGSDILLDGLLLTAANTTITVETGARFEVTGTMEMGEDARIIIQRGAEMIVNGGTITNAKGPNLCYEANQWGEIIIEGNANEPQQLPGNVNDPNRNGVLHLIGATLENGHTFIKMNAKHIPYSQRAEYWGGHVTAVNTTFTNNNGFTNYARVAEFMRYFGEDRSSFTRCTISNVAAGMTHWRNHGVTYNQNTFDNYLQTGILTYNSSIHVLNGNTFDNGFHSEFNQAAIDMYQTFPISTGSVIGGPDQSLLPNQFFGGYHSIYSEAGNPLERPIVVENNVFTGGEYNIRFDGISRHEVIENDLIGPVFGTTLVSNGILNNTQRDNQFSNNEVGIFTFYDNSGYDFLSNCFDHTGRRDVRMHRGTFLENQGNVFTAASNIFSNANFSRRIQMSGFGNNIPAIPLFSYWIEENTLTSDRAVPRIQYINASGGIDEDVSDEYNIFESDDSNFNGCGSITSPGPVNTNNFNCDLPADSDDLPQFIEELESELAQDIITLQALLPYTAEWYQLKHRITQLMKCIQRAKIKLIHTKGKDQKYNELIPRFDDDDFIYQTYIYGVMVENQDYTQAQAYIGGLTPDTEEEVDFITTQQVNMKQLVNYQYTPTKSELNTLYTIGHKTFPMSGYARSLYRYFTGEKIELALPYGADDRSTPRADTSPIIEEANIIASPNPTDGIINVEYGIATSSKLYLYNASGILLEEKRLEVTDQGNLELDLNTYARGIYYLLVRDEATNALIAMEKVVLIH